MKRYRFPLRSVAVIRTHHEMSAREAFAAAVQAFVRTEENLARARRRVTDFETLLAHGRREKFSAALEAESLLAYRQEIVAAAEAERVMKAARATMEQRRAEYIQAHHRLDVVERLEVRGRERHRLETFRVEQAEFDDLSGRRTSRKSLSPL